MLKRWMNFIKGEELGELLDNQEVERVRGILFKGVDEILDFGIAELKKQNIDLYKDMTEERYGRVLNPFKSLKFRAFADQKINMYISALLKYKFKEIKLKEFRYNKDILFLISNKRKHVINISDISDHMNKRLLKEFGPNAR